MHFALPPRKSSYPPPYARNQRSSAVRRRQLKLVAILGSLALIFIYLLTRLAVSSSDRPPPGTPEVVIVTLLDRKTMSESYIKKIKENRDHYAALHGELLTFPASFTPQA